MKAITYNEYGPPDVLQLKEVAKPAPSRGQVLINVRAVEVTKTCCELRSFNPLGFYSPQLAANMGE